MLDLYKRMAVFARVAELGSFTRAAQALDMTVSAVTQHINALEKACGVQLLHRTTRRLALTDAGSRYLEHCLRMVEAAQAAQRTVEEAVEAPSGTLRVACGADIAMLHVVPALADFAARHPRLAIDLRADDHIVDPVREAIDLRIRIGRLRDSNWVARHLADCPEVLCAAPSYLARQGRPKRPDDLAAHEMVSLTLLPSPTALTLVDAKGRKTNVKLASRIATDNVLAAREWMLAGLGLARFALYTVQDALRTGAAERVLPDHELGQLGIYALVPRRDRQPKAVGLCVTHLQDYFRRAMPGK